VGTQNVGPDPVLPEQQHRNQGRLRTKRTFAVYGLVAAFVIIAAVIAINALPGNDQRTTTALIPSASPSAAVPPTAAAYAVDIDTGESTLLFDSPEGVSEYSVGPGGDLVAFQKDDGDGNPQIFVMNADGTGQHQLTHELAAKSPAWSPDGTQIAFRGLAPDSTYEIYVIDVASGEPRRITRESADVDSPYTDQPSWSPDGEWIVYQVGISPVLRRVDIENGAISAIVVDAAIPDVSPDGSQVVYNIWSTSDVGLANIHGSGRATIYSSSSNGDGCCARWSPNGKLIAFQIHPGGTFYVYELATGETRIVATMPGAIDLVDWLDDQTLFISDL
jgi:Tol biopolymer transport system component